MRQPCSTWPLATGYAGFHSQLLTVIAAATDIEGGARVLMTTASPATAAQHELKLRQCEADLRVALCKHCSAGVGHVLAMYRAGAGVGHV